MPKQILENVRIKYDKNGISTRIFSNGTIQVKVVLNEQDMIFKIINVLTDEVLSTNKTKITNSVVLRRAAKRELERVLGVKFKTETKKVRPYETRPLFKKST